MSGSTTIATSEDRLTAFKFQSSAYGVVLPVAYGVARLPGNMLWYGGFEAIPNTSTQDAGGKGGSVKTQQTTFTYRAAVMMGLCEGDITGVARAWRGKTFYDGGVTPSQLFSTSENYVVPGGGGTFVVSNASQFTTDLGVYADLGAGAFGDLAYQLSQGRDYTRSGGTYTFSADFAGRTLTVEYQYTVAGTTQSSLQELGLSLAKGAVGQAVWAYLASTFPSQALAYSGIAYVYASAYDLGSATSVDNHNFEVQAKFAYSVASTLPDADPARILYDIVTNSRYGVTGFPATKLGSSGSWSSYCRAAGLLMSPVFKEQAPAAEVMKTLTDLTNTAMVYSDGVIKFIPYGDTNLSGNGATYTANTTAVYELTHDMFCNLEQPVRVTRKPQADTYNQIQIEFLNRNNQYNIEIAEAKDQANIDVYGLRPKAVIRCHWICDPAVARNVAQLLLQRSLYIRNEYTFQLPWNYVLLEPMDLVTLTDAGLGMDKVPVRITEVSESEEGVLDFKAEDFPLGVASSTLYPSEFGSGFAHNYNVAPGPITTRAIFEAPVNLTSTGLEVYVAVNSTNANWGGCRVWVSSDGDNYRAIARISGGSRVGTLVSAVASNIAQVQIASNKQIISGSASDAAALTTLCYLGGPVPEYVAYTTAALVSAGRYDLTLTQRGAYRSVVNAHAAADQFVRIDSSVAKSGPLDLSLIGKTIFFKFTSFNVYGGAEETVDTVTAVPYLITGVMVQLPPSSPTGLTSVREQYGVRFICDRNPEPDVVCYEWRVGPVANTATVLERNGGTSYLWGVQNTGTFTVWVYAVDALGNRSTPSSLSITVVGGAIDTLTGVLKGANLQLDYTATAGSFAITSYEVRFGTTYATAEVVGTYQVTRFVREVDWVGNRTWWVVPIDAQGNYGTARSVIINIVAPGTVTGSRSETVDNNVLLFWGPPSTGSLPVDRYEVRKGASFAGGTVVGSNGNSTFAAIFEQTAGVFTYWIAAYDSAGNLGSPRSIVATVSEPPDYVLRTSIDSTFNGTLTNMYLERGDVLGPVNTTQTWATHFTGNAWATPADQIAAGFPLYINPSLTSGTYEETIDYGAALGTTTISVTLDSTVLQGAVTASCRISRKLLIGDPWTDSAPGLTKVTVSNFRYIKVTWTFTCTAGANVIRLNAMNVKLSNKLRTDSGSFTVTNALAGAVVNFNVAFVDADTPICQYNSNGTPALVTPVVDFADVPNPTGFTVYLFNAAGTRITGSGSWTARGY